MLCVEEGDKLVFARKERHLTQDDLADALTAAGYPVNRSTLARWEAEQHIPRKRLPQVAAFFGRAPEWFLDGADDSPSVMSGLEEIPNVKEKEADALDRHESGIREGDTVGLPVWRGVQAGTEQECEFVESDSPELRETPLYLTRGHPEIHAICVATGMSMAPRIDHAERALVRLDPDVPPGYIILARNPEGKQFIKRLVKMNGRLELHSINEAYAPITDVAGWEVRGGITCIWHTYEPGFPNMEWDEGRYLR